MLQNEKLTTSISHVWYTYVANYIGGTQNYKLIAYILNMQCKNILADTVLYECYCLPCEIESRYYRSLGVVSIRCPPYYSP